MAQAVGAQALARTAELVPDDAAALRRSATAAYRAIPRHLLTSVAAGPWIKLYSFGSLVVLNAQLQAVVSLQSYAEVAEDSDAAALAERMRTRRRGDARALRLRLLELLRAARRLVAARLPAIRRRAAEAPRAVRRALRLGGDAVRRVRQAAAGVQGHDRRPRLAALLALEARDRDCDDRRGRDQAPLALRRLALARLAGAEARRLLRGARRCRRLGRQPRRVRHAADRARRRDGSQAEGRPPHGSRTRCRAAAARRRCGPHRSRPGLGCGSPRACGSFASASPGRQERLHPTRGSSRRCSGFRHGSGSSSTSPRHRRTTQGGQRSRSTARRSSSRCRRSVTSC